MALGINNIVGVSGFFIGLVLGGILAPIDWRLVFLISVPVGLFGTVWAYRAPARAEHAAAGADGLAGQRDVRARADPRDGRGDLRDPSGRRRGDGLGEPPGADPARGAVACLVVFAQIERRSAHPMFNLALFRIRAFTFGTLSTFLSSIARGGLMFMLVIWLQGVWLPQHGFDFTETPLWAGIYMLPLTVGMLLAGPTSGYLSDRFGARPFATAGMLLTAVGFGLLLLLPTNFAYLPFGAILALIGVVDGDVRLAEPCGGDVEPAAGAPRRRRRDEPDVPELGAGPVGRRLLHADDRRPVGDAPAHARDRPREQRRPGRDGAYGEPVAAGVDPVRRVPRLQPGPAPRRPARRSARCRRTARPC